MNNWNDSVLVASEEPKVIVTDLPPINILYTTSEVIVGIVAVIGNAMTLYVFGVDRKLRRLTNYYIASLALADLLVGVIGIPFAILTAIGIPRSMWFCLPMLCFLMTLCTISIFCLVAVSVDRYWAILYPLVYSRIMTGKIARRIIVFCWFTGTVIGAIPIWWHRSYGDCLFLHIMDYDYLVFLYFATIIFPGLLMAAFYAHIYSVVLKQLRQIEYQQRSTPDINLISKCQHRKKLANGDSVRLSLTSIRESYRLLKKPSAVNIKENETTQYSDQLYHGDNCTCSREAANPRFRTSDNCSVNKNSHYDVTLSQLSRPSKREVKAAKNLSIIVVFFMFCWFPLYTINCISAFCSYCYVPEELLNFTIILSHTNSAVNPILYAYHMKDFRLALQVHILQRLGWMKEKASAMRYPDLPPSKNALQNCFNTNSLHSKSSMNKHMPVFEWQHNRISTYQNLGPLCESIDVPLVPISNRCYEEARYSSSGPKGHHWPPDGVNENELILKFPLHEIMTTPRNVSHFTYSPIKRCFSMQSVLPSGDKILEENEFITKKLTTKEAISKTQSVPSSPKYHENDQRRLSLVADINVEINCNMKSFKTCMTYDKMDKECNSLQRAKSYDSFYNLQGKENNPVFKISSCEANLHSSSYKACSTFRQNKLSKQLMQYL